MRTLAGALERATQIATGTERNGAEFKICLLLSSVLGLDAADKAALSAIAGSIKNAFHIQNFEVGLLIASVSFVGAAFALPVGSLADRVRRKTILLVAVVLWTAAIVFSGTATSFTYLSPTRLLLGAVTAVAGPTIAPLVGDFFPAAVRPGYTA